MNKEKLNKKEKKRKFYAYEKERKKRKLFVHIFNLEEHSSQLSKSAPNASVYLIPHFGQK